MTFCDVLVGLGRCSTAVKRDTLQLLYPLFVYSYLRTVQEKQGMHARDLLTSLKARFLQSESTSVSVVKELDDLSAIVHHQHLQSNAAKEVCLPGHQYVYCQATVVVEAGSLVNLFKCSS